jgi:hypothetical protein
MVSAPKSSNWICDLVVLPANERRLDLSHP